MAFCHRVKLVRIIFVLLAVTTTGAYAADFENRYFASVFSGDLSWVADAQPETSSEFVLKTKFNERFLLRIDDSSIVQIDDPLVGAIVRRYFDYWREALLTPQEIEGAERRLLNDIKRLIALDEFAPSLSDIDVSIGRVLSERGFHYRGGRTQPLLDFMLWRNTRTVRYEVELTDTRQEVTVHFLDDFLVRGWSHFATFARSSTGGWADPDALYCVTEAYDVESESFKNSYLRHEARHFADYKRFPKLKSADLEYRGKLTELAFSSDALILLRGFWQRSNGTSASPHPLANWHVVHDMAETAHATCDTDTLACLESVSNSNLQAAARRLLIHHTNMLEGLGADTVTGTIEVETQ